jgi:hypothetical protein
MMEASAGSDWNPLIGAMAAISGAVVGKAALGGQRARRLALARTSAVISQSEPELWFVTCRAARWPPLETARRPSPLKRSSFVGHRWRGKLSYVQIH